MQRPKMSNKLIILYIAISLFLPAISFSEERDRSSTSPPAVEDESMQEQDDAKPFYKVWEKPGWWWGHYQAEDKPKDKKPAKKDDKAPFIPPPLTAYKYQDLWNMHPDKFQELLMDYQKKAVMAPSEDNVHDYYIMQDIARRKSLEFTNVAMMVWQKNPELNVLKDYPISPIGISSMTRQQNSNIGAKIRNNMDNFGLIYFYSESCDYCAQQTNILRSFIDKYGWQVKKVEISREPDIAARFNAETVPMIIMVQRDTQNYMPVTSGLATLNEIEDNLYRGIRLMSGEITPEQYSQYEFQDKSSFNPDGMMKNGDSFIRGDN